MKKLTLIFLFLTATTFSQVEKNLGDFNKVTTFDRIDVLLIPSSENRILIQGADADNVETINKNGELKIRMNIANSFKGDTVSVTLYYKRINALEANEGSFIHSEAVFSGSLFSVIAKEGSQIKVQFSIEKLNVKLLQGSQLETKGTATSTDVLVNTGAIYNAKNLETSNTTITVNAGGEADIFASKAVNAKVRAGGNILIYGNPNDITQKIIAGGTITEAN